MVIHCCRVYPSHYSQRQEVVNQNDDKYLMPLVGKKRGCYKIVVLVHSYCLVSVELRALVRSYSHKGSNPGNSVPVGCNKRDGDQHPQKKNVFPRKQGNLRGKNKLPETTENYRSCSLFTFSPIPFRRKN